MINGTWEGHADVQPSHVLTDLSATVRTCESAQLSWGGGGGVVGGAEEPRMDGSTRSGAGDTQQRFE